MRSSRIIAIGTVVSAILLFCSTSSQAQQFAPFVNYTTDRGPIFAAVADVNGDGKLDIVSSIYIDSFVDVLLGNGDGTFQPAISSAGGGDSPWIVVGDLNGDGIPDLVTANYNTANTVSVLLGNGDGTFKSHVDYATGTSPYAVAIGDFDGDGRPDLVSANFSGSISFLKGNGDGTFQTHSDFNTGTAPQAIAVADLNGDGKLDVILGNPSPGTITIMFGNGDGTFKPGVNYPAGAPYFVAIADVNNDGILDLIGSSACCNMVNVLLGNGDGTFKPEVSYPAGETPYGVAAGDFNADGKVDLATVNYTGANVSLLFGNGDGTFQPPVDYATGAGPADSIVAADFNSDGMLDLMVPDFATGSGTAVSVLMNAGSGGGVPQASLSASKLAFGQVVLGSSSSYRNVIVSNPGTGTLHFGAIGLTGADSGDFRLLNNCGTTLVAQASCTIEINLQPKWRGSKNAALTISDDANNSPQSVVLGGGATSNLLSANAVNFGSVSVGASATASLVLTNVGSMATSVGSVKIYGPDQGDFSQTNTCGNSVAGKGNCTFTITFSPDAKGRRSANLEFTSNGTGMNAITTIPLVGQGS
jgi:hypothetical protein